MKICTHSVDDPCTLQCIVSVNIDPRGGMRECRAYSLDLALWNYDAAVRGEEKRQRWLDAGGGI